jgi:hypothetical protein
LAGYGGKNTKKINEILFDQGYIEKASISWMLTDKPRIIQSELLEKFKKDHGDLPVWNTKKKLSVKLKGTTAFNSKKAPVSKTKVVTPKTIASIAPKSRPKAKAITLKKSAQKEDSLSKTEPTSKTETATEMPDKAKPKTELPSDKSMTT